MGYYSAQRQCLCHFPSSAFSLLFSNLFSAFKNILSPLCLFRAHLHTTHMRSRFILSASKESPKKLSLKVSISTDCSYTMYFIEIAKLDDTCEVQEAFILGRNESWQSIRILSAFYFNSLERQTQIFKIIRPYLDTLANAFNDTKVTNRSFFFAKAESKSQ